MTGCNNVESMKKTTDDKQIIFFSDEENSDEEINYYDALIELKRMYPDEFTGMEVAEHQEDKEVYQEYNISSPPALVVMYKNETVVSLNGNLKKEEIIRPVSSAIDSIKNH